MKKYFRFKKKTFFIFLALGIAVFIIDFFIQIFWLRFVRFIFNQPNFGYDFQPATLKYIQSFLAYSPWVILGVVLIADILKRNFARSISFFLGLALVYVSFIGYIFLGPTVSDYVYRT